MCHPLPPQSRHSHGAIVLHSLHVETQVFSAHQPRLEFPPNSVAWMWKCVEIRMAHYKTWQGGQKRMTWVWSPDSLETVVSLLLTTVSHQCLAVLA